MNATRVSCGGNRSYVPASLGLLKPSSLNISLIGSSGKSLGLDNGARSLEGSCEMLQRQVNMHRQQKIRLDGVPL